MLAAQMATIHNATMTFASRLNRAGGYEQGVQVKSSPLVRTGPNSHQGRCVRDAFGTRQHSGPPGEPIRPCRPPTGWSEHDRERFSGFNQPALLSGVLKSGIEFSNPAWPATLRIAALAIDSR